MSSIDSKNKDDINNNTNDINGINNTAVKHRLDTNKESKVDEKCHERKELLSSSSPSQSQSTSLNKKDNDLVDVFHNVSSFTNFDVDFDKLHQMGQGMVDWLDNVKNKAVANISRNLNPNIHKMKMNNINRNNHMDDNNYNYKHMHNNNDIWEIERQSKRWMHLTNNLGLVLVIIGGLVTGTMDVNLYLHGSHKGRIIRKE